MKSFLGTVHRKETVSDRRLINFNGIHTHFHPFCTKKALNFQSLTGSQQEAEQCEYCFNHPEEIDNRLFRHSL